MVTPSADPPCRDGESHLAVVLTQRQYLAIMDAVAFHRRHLRFWLTDGTSLHRIEVESVRQQLDGLEAAYESMAAVRALDQDVPQVAP